MTKDKAQKIFAAAKEAQKGLALACLTQKFFKRVKIYPARSQQDTVRQEVCFAKVFIADHSLGVKLLGENSNNFSREEYKYEKFLTEFEPCTEEELRSNWLARLSKADAE
jgi:hypothetical protein